MTSEERAELRALCEPLRKWAGYAVAEDPDGALELENVIYWQAAEGIARLLDALERSERTVERLRDTALAAIEAGDWKVDGACDPDLDGGA